MDAFTSPIKYSAVTSLAQRAKAHFQFVDGWQVVTTFTAVENELEAARQAVALSDVSSAGKILMEGEALDQLVESVWGVPAPSNGRGLAAMGDRIFCLRDDLLLAWIRPGNSTEKLGALRKAVSSPGPMATVTDITHGRAALRLVGPESRSMLARLCGLDFSSEEFPNLAIRASSVAKTLQWVLRDDLRDMDSFIVLGARSLGEYLWEVLIETGKDLGIQPMGRDALENLL